MSADPAARDVIERGIAQTVVEKFPGCDILMGTSTAGIPHAAIAALADDGKLKRADVAKAIKLYGIDVDKANPMGV